MSGTPVSDFPLFPLGLVALPEEAVEPYRERLARAGGFGWRIGTFEGNPGIIRIR